MRGYLPGLFGENILRVDERVADGAVGHLDLDPIGAARDPERQGIPRHERAGVRAAFRKVFLDDTPTREAVLAQLALAAKDAEKDYKGKLPDLTATDTMIDSLLKKNQGDAALSLTKAREDQIATVSKNLLSSLETTAPQR